MKEIRTIYADGGVCGSGTSQIGGTWAVCAVDENDELVWEKSGFHKVEAGTTSNQSEFLAAVVALESMELGWSGTLASDSQITLGRLFKGWSTKNLPLEYIERARRALARLGVITPLQLDGHPTKEQLKTGIGKRGNPVSKWNKRCDYLCGKAKELANESN